MALRFRGLLLWLSVCLLLATGSQAQEDPIQQHQAYIEAAGAVLAAYSTHLLYELALYSYGVAANFHLTSLYARSALFVQKAVELIDERSRYYTTQGDEYFQRAVLLAQADGCASPPPAR